MKGKHHIILETKRIRYEFDIKRNITVIQGDSATGKTTLIGLLAEYARFDETTGIRLQSDVPCVVYGDSLGRWEDDIASVSNSIVFIDEGHSFIKSKDFARIVGSTSNYYVLVTREPLVELPYSINEIYGIRTSGKYHYPEKIYQEFYPLYSSSMGMGGNSSDRVLILEDKKSGYQFFSKVCDNVRCVAASGNSHILDVIKGFDGLRSVIADGAAFGAYIEDVVLYASVNPEIMMYFPESFEWLILKSGVIESADISDILEHPEDYIESSEYVSWERFFTDLLVERTKGDKLTGYTKTKLKSYYTNERNSELIMELLPEEFREYLYVRKG